MVTVQIRTVIPAEESFREDPGVQFFSYPLQLYVDLRYV